MSRSNPASIRVYLCLSVVAVLLRAAGTGLAAAQDRINVDEAEQECAVEMKPAAQIKRRAAARLLSLNSCS
jgi:hypothetical protein